MSKHIQVNEATDVATMLIATKADLTDTAWLLESVVEACRSEKNFFTQPKNGLAEHERSCSFLTALSKAKIDIDQHVSPGGASPRRSSLLFQACEGKFMYPLKLLDCLIANKVW